MGTRHADPSAARDPETEAAEWVVRLSSDDPLEQRRAEEGYAQWRKASADNERAASRVDHFLGRTRRLVGNSAQPDATGLAARRALGSMVNGPRQGKPNRGARAGRAVGLLALCVSLVLPALGWWQGELPTDLLSDVHTAAGEQRRYRLPDGSALLLSSRTAVNFREIGAVRRLELLHGEVLVDVAKDPGRPFVVETDHGRIRALGTRFIVRREGAATLLTMLESRTQVSAGSVRGADDVAQPVIVAAGQVARLSAGHIERLSDIPAALTEEAYRQQRLIVSDRPLAEVLDELSRHRRGLIRFDRQAIEGIRVSAVLRLDDTDQSLQLLAASFPQLRFRTVAGMLVLVELAG